MAATGTSVRQHTRVLAGRRYDDVFFSGVALLILVTVFVGFAHTYYLAGLFRAPLPSLVVHLHGAAFSCWILLLVVQTSLVAARRVDIHRRLGVVGFTLACLMVVLGVWVNNRALTRGGGGPPDAGGAAIYFLGFSLLLIFGVLVACAFYARSNPKSHKRFILIATVALLLAAMVRLPFAFLRPGIEKPTCMSYAFLLFLLVYDLWSTHKIHRATLAGSAFLIVTEQAAIVLGPTAKAQAIAGWIYQSIR